MTAYSLGVLTGLLLMGAIGYSIGDKKGRGALGLILGLVLGLIGVAIIALIPAKSRYDRLQTFPMGMPPMGPAMMPPTMVACPSCRNPMRADESVCTRCGTQVVQGNVRVPEVGSTYSPIQPESWWYQEQGQPAPAQMPTAGAPRVSPPSAPTPPAPPPMPGPGGGAAF